LNHCQGEIQIRDVNQFLIQGVIHCQDGNHLCYRSYRGAIRLPGESFRYRCQGAIRFHCCFQGENRRSRPSRSRQSRHHQNLTFHRVAVLDQCAAAGDLPAGAGYPS
jgi:hypothetical protein